MGRILVLILLIPLLFQTLLNAKEQKRLDEAFLLLMGARNASKARRYETSINRYKRLLEKNPQLYEARRELGWVLLQINRIEEAINEFEIVHMASPKDTNVLRGLLSCFRKAGKEKDAVIVLNQLVRLLPKDRELRFQLAIELHNQGKYAEAERHISILLGEKGE